MTPRELTLEQLKEIDALMDAGKPKILIAQQYGIKKSAFNTYFARHNIKDLISPKKGVTKYEIKFHLNAETFEEKEQYQKYVSRQINTILKHIRHIQVHQWSPYYTDSDKYVYTLYYLEDGTEVSHSFSKSHLISVLKSTADEMCLLCKI